MDIQEQIKKPQQLEKYLSSIDKFVKIINDLAGWLAFFYTDKWGRVYSIKFRKPFTKEFRYFKEGKYAGIFSVYYSETSSQLLVVEGEFNALKLLDIYLKCGDVPDFSICAVGGIKLRGESTKTGRSRIVPISINLEMILKRLPRNGEYVFTYKGFRLKDIRSAFMIACKRAGIVDFRFHDLRHCFVTRMRRKGVPDRVIMAITGHQTLECFKRYDTISIDDLKQAVG